MDFTIYSIGETAFMYEVLMGLRRMFDFGFSSLHILIGATALLSLMTLVVKSWINPNSNPVLSWFIGLCMFMVLCGPFSKVDVVIDSGFGGNVPSTVIDATNQRPIIIRHGAGEFVEAI